MDVDKYDEYVRKPVQEVITVETRIKPENKGFALLAKMGWAEGQPLGLSEDGE
jgi:G-patch domain